LNPHPIRVDGDDGCRWCDGTGWYVRAAMRLESGIHPDCPLPPQLMEDRNKDGEVIATRDVRCSNADWVRCGYCAGTGARTANIRAEETAVA
jgi:hypothetical protein